jgi:Flp pilus assembly protein TadG
MDLSRKRMRIRECGSAMVELVFILPLMCMLIFAVAEFGIAFGQWQAINNAAREGARTAIVFRGNCVIAAVNAEVTLRVESYAAPLGIAPADMTIVPQNVCGAAGTNAVVNVTVPYNFAILPGFAPSVSPSVTLTAQSTMRNEG